MGKKLKMKLHNKITIQRGTIYRNSYIIQSGNYLKKSYIGNSEF